MKYCFGTKASDAHAQVLLTCECISCPESDLKTCEQSMLKVSNKSPFFENVPIRTLVPRLCNKKMYK